MSIADEIANQSTEEVGNEEETTEETEIEETTPEEGEETQNEETSELSEDELARARELLALEKDKNVDFTELVPEFTRRSQELAELKKGQEEIPQGETDDVGLQEFAALASKAGFVTREEQAMRESAKEEAIMLSSHLDNRVKEYKEKGIDIDDDKVFDLVESYEAKNPTPQLIDAAINTLYQDKIIDSFKQEAVNNPPVANISSGISNVDRKSKSSTPTTFDSMEESMLDTIEAGNK